jgi:hypothetical protein
MAKRPHRALLFRPRHRPAGQVDVDAALGDNRTHQRLSYRLAETLLPQEQGGAAKIMVVNPKASNAQ